MNVCPHGNSCRHCDPMCIPGNPLLVPLTWRRIEAALETIMRSYGCKLDRIPGSNADLKVMRFGEPACNLTLLAQDLAKELS